MREHLFKIAVSIFSFMFISTACAPSKQADAVKQTVRSTLEENTFVKLYPSFIVDNYILLYSALSDVKKEGATHIDGTQKDTSIPESVIAAFGKLKEKKIIDAQNLLKEAISAGLSIPSIYNLQGVLHCILGRYDKAADNFDKAESLWNDSQNRPGSKIAIINKGVTLALQGMNQKAVSLFNKGMEDTDSFNRIQIKSAGLINLAPIYFSQHVIDPALDASLKALELSRQIKDKKIELLTSAILGKLYFSREEYTDVFNRDPFEDSIRHSTDALYLSRELKEVRQEIDVIVLFGYISLEGGVLEDALALFEKSLDMSETSRHSIGIVDSLRGLGIIDMFEDNFEDSITDFSDAITISRNIGYLEGEMNCLAGIGDVYRSMEEYEKALTYYYDSLEISKKLKSKRFTGRILTRIADSFYRSGNYKKAIEYHQRALTINTANNYRKGKITNLTYLGLSYRKIGDNALAREFSQKSIDFSKAGLKFRRERAISINNIANIYIDEGNWREGKRSLLRSLELSKVMGDNVISIDNMTNLGILYQKEDHLEKAYKYFFDALQLSKKEGLVRTKVDNLINLGNYYRLTAKHKKALLYYKDAYRISKDVGYALGKANSLALIGFVEYLNKKFDSAKKNLKDALALYKKLHMPKDESFVMGILGNIN